VERGETIHAFFEACFILTESGRCTFEGSCESRDHRGMSVHQFQRCAVLSKSRQSHSNSNLLQCGAFPAHSALLRNSKAFERLLLTRQCQRWNKPAPSKPWRNSGRVEWLAGKCRRGRIIVSVQTEIVKLCKASRDGVVACWRGVLNFCAVLKDSPKFPSHSEAAFPSASRTWLLSFACASVPASRSPVTQFIALRIRLLPGADQCDRNHPVLQHCSFVDKLRA